MMLAAAAVRDEAPHVLTRKPPWAIGISGKGNDYRIAVRVQRVESGLQTVLDEIRERCKGEMVVRHVGKVLKQVPWHQKQNRPLRIGGSIGHVDITAGTLGCFVTPRSGHGKTIVLMPPRPASPMGSSIITIGSNRSARLPASGRIRLTKEKPSRKSDERLASLRAA
jgi:hypothetical protein